MSDWQIFVCAVNALAGALGGWIILRTPCRWCTGADADKFTAIGEACVMCGRRKEGK